MSAASDRCWTVLELLRWTAEHFGSRGIQTARLDAECLLASALGTNRVGLYVAFEEIVPETARAVFRELVRRRADERVPVSLLLGVKEFWSLRLRVSGEVLTPRPETETLVLAALDRLPDPEGEYRVLDLGTGSGAIALAIARERPKSRIVATDISPAALQIAAENADQLQLSERIRWLEGSLFEPVTGDQFDLVVSNPPYLARADAQELPPELAFEPDIALFGGEDGLAVLRPLVGGAGGVLVPGGALAVEIDPGQVAAVVELFVDAGYGPAEVLRDTAAQPRAIAAAWPGRGGT